MKTFFKDYVEYAKASTELSKKWYKKHWKGTVLLILIIWIVELGWIFRDLIKEKFAKKNSKGIEE